MQKHITKKSDIRDILTELESFCQSDQWVRFWDVLETKILAHKIKFPLLEFLAKEMTRFLPFENQLAITDEIMRKGYIGGNVIAGIILQQRLSDGPEEPFAKAIEYFLQGDQWFVCDIISERVMGVALLIDFEQSFLLLKSQTLHSNHWVKRSVGIATHYATKKGLEKKNVETLFHLIIDNASDKNIHVMKGLGWALKTIARYHPELALRYQPQINASPQIGNWYKRKISMGLEQAKQLIES